MNSVVIPKMDRESISPYLSPTKDATFQDPVAHTNLTNSQTPSTEINEVGPTTAELDHQTAQANYDIAIALLTKATSDSRTAQLQFDTATLLCEKAGADLSTAQIREANTELDSKIKETQLKTAKEEMTEAKMRCRKAGMELQLMRMKLEGVLAGNRRAAAVQVNVGGGGIEKRRGTVAR